MNSESIFARHAYWIYYKIAWVHIPVWEQKFRCSGHSDSITLSLVALGGCEAWYIPFQLQVRPMIDEWQRATSSQCALWMTFVCRSIIITIIINSKHLLSVLLWGQLSGNEVLNWWNDLRCVIFLTVFFIRNNWEPKIRISYTRPVYHEAMLKRQEIVLMEGSLRIIAPLVL